MKNIALIGLFYFVASASFAVSPNLSETISGEVVLSKKIQKKVPSKGVLFVFARTADPKGRGFPLAVKRIENPKFPVKFKLSQKDAMVDGTEFKGAIKIVARFSPSGDVMNKKGAFEGIIGADQKLIVGQTRKVEVSINKKL